MKTLGMAGSARPRAKPEDYDAVIALLTALHGDKETKKYAGELRDATLVYDKAREEAEAAERKAAERNKAASRAELDATVARQALADESAEAQVVLAKRETAVTEREQTAGEVEKSQVLRDKELARREAHLKQAGVRGF